jgi:hypothetical protein
MILIRLKTVLSAEDCMLQKNAAAPDRKRRIPLSGKKRKPLPRGNGFLQLHFILPVQPVTRGPGFRIRPA